MIGPAAAALAAAVFFAVGAPAAKALLDKIDPRLLAALLYLGSGVALGGFGGIRGRGVRALPRRDLAWLSAAIVSGGIVAPLLFVFGLTRTSAWSASLVLVLEAPLSALWARLWFGEHLGVRTLEALALITLGAAATVGPGDGGADPLGLAAVALACACWALDNNFTREIASADAVMIAASKGLVGGAANLALALGLGAAWPAPGAILLAGLVGAVSYGASLVLYVMSLRGLGTARAAAYFGAAPFVGALVSVVALEEPATVRLAFAAALMALGVWRLAGERHRHSHRHDAVEHFHVHVHDAHHRHAHAEGEVRGPHAHVHTHEAFGHDHPHAPDLHHRHRH